MPCGNVRRQPLSEIWHRSPALVEMRGVRVRDLPTCSHCNHVAYCTRCPGLAYMEGNFRGPSQADCAKAEARTGLPVVLNHTATCNCASHVHHEHGAQEQSESQ
jgi:hypothetical protein